MRTIALSNHKGGTGKTSLAVHLAVGLAQQGERVLLVDLDYQQTATRWLLKLSGPLPASVPGAPRVLERGVIDGPELHPSPLAASLMVLPSTKGLPAAELAVANAPAGQTHLRRALHGVRKRFDFCVVDCAPSMGTGTVAGLCAADNVFVPIPPQYLSLVGVGELQATIKRLREGFKVGTSVGGYILFSVDTREGLAVATRELLQREAAGMLLRAEVRVSTAGKKLPEAHQTAWDAGADARGAEDYKAVLREVIRRVER